MTTGQQATRPHYHYSFPHGRECTDPRCPDWVADPGPRFCSPGRHIEGCPMAVLA